LDDLLLLPPPSEKERRRMALVVSCVALFITVFAALLVGITLGMSHLMVDMVPVGESVSQSICKIGQCLPPPVNTIH
jgi:uncharacterized membrane protein